MNTRRHIAPVLPVATDRLALQPLGLDAVTIRSGAWADWQRDNRSVTTPHSFHWLERDGTVDNLRRLDPSGTGRPERRGPWFTDSDLYKALEAVAWDLGREDSPELNELVTEISDIIRRAQAPDGYINSFVQAGLDVRWDNLVKSHELYCIGHLIQAGIAHRRSTGRSELFDVAVAAADVVVADFGDGRRSDTDGHEEIEMALVELFRETGNRTYLDLAQQLVDVRGYKTLDTTNFGDSPYYQDATPVRDETTVVGHAVRAIYLLAGVVDIAIETGEEALLTAALTQWESMTATKTYLNGAVGSRFIGEAFGDAYELPPDLAYGETCATIGNIMTSWRLLLLTGESRFADAIERALYNLFAASTAADRKGFFYNNPAQRRTALDAAPINTRPDRADAPGTRPAWFECACCPPNIMRTIASLSAYVSTATVDSIQLHQFMPATVETEIEAGEVVLQIETRYPIDGYVDVTVTRSTGTEWALELRVPDWAAASATVTINGIAAAAEVTSRGYARVIRAWVPGDVVTFILPVKARLTVAHPAVDAVRGSVAIERGPVVYAFESVDQASEVDLNHVELLDDPQLEEEVHDDFLGQPAVLITARGRARKDGRWNAGWMKREDVPPSDGEDVVLRAIPYALWANRGPSVMRVFVPVEGTMP